MKTAINRLIFANLPKDFTGLCRLHAPRPIHDRVEMHNTSEIADLMAPHENRMTRDQADYYDLLCTIIEEYEREHYPELDQMGGTGLTLLKNLLENHGMNASALSRLLGVDRTLGAKILRGERHLTVAHIRILTKRFKLRPEAFI